MLEILNSEMLGYAKMIFPKDLLFVFLYCGSVSVINKECQGPDLVKTLEVPTTEKYWNTSGSLN